LKNKKKKIDALIIFQAFYPLVSNYPFFVLFLKKKKKNGFGML